MPNVRLLSLIVAEISLIKFPFVVLKGPFNCRNHAVGSKGEVSRDDQRAADKVATWKVFKRRMEVIFMADQIPEERQWALILVAGGDKAYNRWDTLQDTVKDRKVVKQVWDAFEKSSNNQLHFGISEMLIWQTSDKTNRRQRPTWISTSSRLSGDANGRKSLKRSE